MTYITGFHAITELINAGKGKGGVILVAAVGPRVKRIIQAAEQAGIALRRVQPAELDATAPGHRGIALAIKETPATKNIDLTTWLDSAVPDRAIVLVLDHIEDPHNLGAIIRSADVFAVDLLVMPERRAARETDTVAKASAGAIAYVPLATVGNLARAIEELKDHGFWTYAADMGGEVLPKADLPGRIALVMGAEGSGVSRLLKERCDGILSIPQYGHIDSLNVSVAAGVFLYELRRRTIK
jgi:23S rRNA (guanosine2251-2'-O)-methyltransferase